MTPKTVESSGNPVNRALVSLITGQGSLIYLSLLLTCAALKGRPFRDASPDLVDNF